jgi:type III secretory pathway lipoprotein EscJ
MAITVDQGVGLLVSEQSSSRAVELFEQSNLPPQKHMVLSEAYFACMLRVPPDLPSTSPARAPLQERI